MPDSTALEPTVIDEDLCRRCVGKLQPPTERQGEGSSDAKKETAQREIKYLMFSYKNILKIDNLVGFDKLVKLQVMCWAAERWGSNFGAADWAGPVMRAAR